MFYYEVGLIGANIAPLTYHSSEELAVYDLVKVSVKNSTKEAIVLKSVEKPPFETREVTQKLRWGLNEFQAQLLEFISRYYTCQIGVCAGLFSTFNNAADIKNKEIANELPKNFTPIKLSPKQLQAKEFAQNNRFCLLFGDTGSGKSEIYFSLIEEVLQQGKQAVFLMPEISLTPQMTARLKAHFGDVVGVWHSKITAKAKQKLLAQIASGEVRLVAGARSAIFLPLDKLGLIIVDEEHDESYKSNSAPFYNARDLAVFLANQFEGVKTLLGSATPSVTSLAKFPTFRLKGSFFRAKREFVFDNSPTSVSNLILTQLANTLDADKQAVVFLPTRANFRSLVCKGCGELVKCKYCSVAMSFYRGHKRALKCHYCGFESLPPKECAVCKSELFSAEKIGTSEVVLQLQKHFPHAKIAKFDRDEITTQKKLEATLEAFKNKEIDILVGTQMLSKGHDYHNVNLAVILGLDDLLGFADYRAREKTLALAIQVAGRAGRNGEAVVVLQSANEEFFKKFIEDYDSFAADENASRAKLYPPHSRLMRISISNKDAAKCEQIEREILAHLHALSGRGSEFSTKVGGEFEIVGFGLAAIEFLAGLHRRYILLRANSHQPLLKAAKIAQKFGAKADIDPINFS